MIKIEKSAENIFCNAGAAIALELFNKASIGQLIDSHLGKRVRVAGYDYSEILYALFLSQLSGSSCIEDVQMLREQWSEHPSFKTCSADTILRGITELSTADTRIISNSGVEHTFNINERVNELLVKLLLHTGQLTTGGDGYMLDYDNTIVECEKYDVKRTYKHTEGYQPGVATIGKFPVYIEGRNGNSNAKYLMKDTLEHCTTLLEQKGIVINAFRSDCAAYQKEVIDFAEDKHWKFYIRALASTDLKLQIKKIPANAWKSIRYNLVDIELAELYYSPFQGDKSYRIVVQRKKKTSNQIDAFSGDCYEYYGILTNDKLASIEEVYTCYNQRASSEKIFDSLKNDFNWNHLPCSFLNQNTTFMALAAISYVLFEWLKIKVGSHIEGIEATARLKQFIYRFIQVAGKWIRSGRQTILKIFSNKRYELLLTDT